MRAITELQPDTRYHRICLQSPLENQYQNVKHKLAAGDLLFVMDRLREESLLFDEVILDDLRFYGFVSHIREILGGPGAFLASSAPKIFDYMQALIQDKDELAVYIIKNVPDLLFCLDDETKAKYGLWEQLVKEKKWAVLRKNKKYALLEKAGKEYREARGQLAIAGEYFRIFRHPGWEEDITWVIDENHQFILTYQELVAHGFWDLAYEQYEDLLKFQYLLGYNTEQQWKLLTNILFCICKAPEGANFLCKKNNAEVNQFLWNEGYSWLFAQNKNWLYLAQKEAYDDINWEDFVTSSDNKLLVYKSAYKAGEADFLLFHRQYKYYFRLKWKQLWKKKKNCE